MTPPLEKIQLIRNALKRYLELDDDHCYIYNNKWLKINDTGMYCVVGVESEEIVGNNLYYEKTESELISIVSTVSVTAYYVDVFSYSTEARKRRLEVHSFFASDECARLQDYNEFRIYSISPSFIDISEAEGSKMLNRYRLFFKVARKEEFRRSSPYFDTLGGFGFFINN